MRFDCSVTIRRPPSAVFAMLADIQEYGKQERAARVPVMEKVTQGPTRVGTRWHEVIRMAPRVTFTIWSEVVAIEQDRLLDERFWSWWFRGRLEYTLTEVDGGTVLRQRERLEPRGPFRLADGLIARQLGPNIEWRLGEIRRMLEEEKGALGPPGQAPPEDAATDWVASRPPSRRRSALAGQSAGRAHAHSG